MTRAKIEKLPEGADLQAFAQEVFGEDARVPLGKHHLEDAPVVGYIETPDGTYAVVEDPT